MKYAGWSHCVREMLDLDSLERLRGALLVGCGIPAILLTLQMLSRLAPGL